MVTIINEFLLLERVTYPLENLMKAPEALSRKNAHKHTYPKCCIWGLLLLAKMNSRDQFTLLSKTTKKDKIYKTTVLKILDISQQMTVVHERQETN